MKIGKSPSHIVSAVKPEDKAAAGGLLTLITIGAETVVQLSVLVTATVIWSPLFAVVVTTFAALGPTKVIPFRMNS